MYINPNRFFPDVSPVPEYIRNSNPGISNHNYYRVDSYKCNYTGS